MYQPSLLESLPPWLPDALALLARHRFLSARQLAGALKESPEAVTSACAALVAEGALRELRQSTLAGRDGASPAYAPTALGLSRIAVDPAGLRPRATRSLRSAFSVAHELLVNEVALVLEVLDRAGILSLLSWTTARERIGDVAHIAERGRAVRVPLVADGLAIIEVHGIRHALLVEVDLGTVAVKTMQRKYKGYASWWADGGHVRRLGLPATRVLTVAPAPRRLERLREAAIEGLDGRGSGLLWFLPHAAVDIAAPERLLAPLATVAKAGEDQPRGLFPP